MSLESEKVKRPLVSRIFRGFFFVFLALSALTAVAFSLIFYYSDEVKAAILKELNKHLKAEVRVLPENIDLTLIRSFPDCSLQFKDVAILEPSTRKRKDTLLFAGFLNLHFSLRDLWNGNYTIKEISMSGASAHMKISKNGDRNFIVWEQGDSTTNSNTEFDLKKIKIEKTEFKYTDERSGFKTGITISSLIFTGHFKSNSYTLSSNARLFVNTLTIGKSQRLKNKNLSYEVVLNVKDNHYKIEKSELRLNKLRVLTAGEFKFENEVSDLRLTFNAPELDIQALLSLLPQGDQDRVKDYRSEGSLYASGNLNYISSKKFQLNTKFGLKNTVVVYRPTDVAARDINVDGSIVITDNSSHLLLDQISLDLNGDKLAGNLRIDDFKDPSVNLECKANFHFEHLQSFWPIDTLQEIKGIATLTTAIKGNLQEIKKQILSTNNNIALEAHVKDLVVKFKHDSEPFEVDNCNLKARDREVQVDDLRLRRGASDVTVSGRVPGLFNYLLDPSQMLTISGSLKSSLIRIEDFISVQPGTSSPQSGPVIPAGVHFKLDAMIDRFTFGKFEAKAITGDIEIKNRKALINEVFLKTAEGSASINAFADNSSEKLKVVLQSQIAGIDISSLFTEFNNFGQTAIIDKNLRGRASATVDFAGVWDEKLVIDDKTIRASCNLLIERGELVDFKPLLHLSRFVEVEELKRIRFSTLHTHVTIADRIVHIPRTSIKNTALNVDFWGTHDFDNQIDYHIQLLLSELLAKKRKNKDSEFGEVAADSENTRSAFIRMTGSIDNPKIRYDKQGMKEKIKQDLKEEKQTIRHLMREEFGLFKKDTSLGRKPSEQQPEFKLEEEEKPKPKKTLELKKKEEEDF